MKYFIYLMITTIIISGCNGKGKGELSNPRLKECIIKSYKYNFGELDSVINGITVIEYDSLENDIETIQKDKFGTITFIRKVDYKYYPDGKLHELVIYDKTSNPIAKYVSYYDSNGVKFKEEETHINYEKEYDNLDFQTTYFKYKDSLLIEEKVSPSNVRRTYTYNKDKLLIEDRSYYDGRLGWATTYKYDPHGNRIFESHSDVGDNFRNTRLYKYDELNRQIEEISLDENGHQVFRMTSLYGSNNRKTEGMDYGPMDEPRSFSKYTYVFK